VLLIFVGGWPPFTEIYIVLYKNECGQVFKKEAYRDCIKRKWE
jgi:hypothetical protein